MMAVPRQLAAAIAAAALLAPSASGATAPPQRRPAAVTHPSTSVTPAPAGGALAAPGGDVRGAVGGIALDAFGGDVRVALVGERATIVDPARAAVPTDPALPATPRIRRPDDLLAVVAERLRASGQLVLDTATASEASGGAADALDVGDVDGDGASDVGIVEVSQPQQQLAFRAVRGSDGSAVWSVPLASAGYVVSRTDLTGDGAADFIRFAVPRYDVLASDCDAGQTACAHYLAVFEWHVAVLSGRDLREVWSDRVSGRLEEVYRETVDADGRHYTYRYEVRNGWVVPHVLGAATPTGRALLLHRWDVDDAWEYHDSAVPVVAQDRYTKRVRTTDHVRLVDSDSGRERRAAVLGPARGFTTVVPVGDIDGDGNEDAALEMRGRSDTDLSCLDLVLHRECTGAREEFHHAVDLLDGGTLTAAWRHETRATDGAFVVLDGDVDGDGVGDVAHQWTQAAERGAPRRDGTVVLSGARGAPLWSLDVLAALVGLGDLDADGRDDVLHTVVVHAPGVADVQLRRLDGRSGSEVLRTTHRFGGGSGNELGYTYVTEDVDRDGVRDLAVGRITYAPSGAAGGSATTSPNAAAFVESGRSAARPWEVDAPGERTLRPLADLDGDGLREYDWTGSVGASVIFDIRRGADGRALWRRDEDGTSGYVVAVGDHDGDGLDDVATVHDRQDDGESSTTIAALRGVDGTPRWTVLSAL